MFTFLNIINMILFETFTLYMYYFFDFFNQYLLCYKHVLAWTHTRLLLLLMLSLYYKNMYTGHKSPFRHSIVHVQWSWTTLSKYLFICIPYNPSKHVIPTRCRADIHIHIGPTSTLTSDRSRKCNTARCRSDLSCISNNHTSPMSSRLKFILY